MPFSVCPFLPLCVVCCAALCLAGCGTNDGDDEGTGGDGSGGNGATGGNLEPTAPGIFSINEVLPSNANVVQDEAGAYPDFIEIYNAAEGASDLAGYWISDTDTVDEVLKFQLPETLVVPAGGVLLLFADDDEEDEGPRHVGFSLNRAAESVILSGPDGTRIDSFSWTAADIDVSYARFPDGTGEFEPCAWPTPGELNGSACGD